MQEAFEESLWEAVLLIWRKDRRTVAWCMLHYCKRNRIGKALEQVGQDVDVDKMVGVVVQSDEIKAACGTRIVPTKAEEGSQVEIEPASFEEVGQKAILNGRKCVDNQLLERRARIRF